MTRPQKSVCLPLSGMEDKVSVSNPPRQCPGGPNPMTAGRDNRPKDGQGGGSQKGARGRSRSKSEVNDRRINDLADRSPAVPGESLAPDTGETLPLRLPDLFCELDRPNRHNDKPARAVGFWEFSFNRNVWPGEPDAPSMAAICDICYKHLRGLPKLPYERFYPLNRKSLTKYVAWKLKNGN